MDATDLTATVISPNGWSINVPLVYRRYPAHRGHRQQQYSKRFHGFAAVATNSAGTLVGTWTSTRRLLGTAVLRGIIVDPYQQHRQKPENLSVLPPLADSEYPDLSPLSPKNVAPGLARQPCLPDTIAATGHLHAHCRAYRR